MKARDPRAFGLVDDYFVNSITGLLERRDYLKEIGEWPRKNRTAEAAVDDFGVQYNYPIADGQKFPLLSVKSTHWLSILHELVWFFSGSTNIRYLKDNGVRIWNEWADEDGELGPVYGKQWRSWTGVKTVRNGPLYVPTAETFQIDQLKASIDLIRKDPGSRRNIVSAWNVSDLPAMALQPCHVMFQWHVDHDGLSLQLYQRSADWFLGVPFNVASYSLLLMIVAKMTGLRAHRFIHTIGSMHLYEDHFDEAGQLANAYLNCPARMETNQLPTVKISDRISEIQDISEFKIEDVVLENYDPWPAVKVKVSV